MGNYQGRGHRIRGNPRSNMRRKMRTIAQGWISGTWIPPAESDGTIAFDGRHYSLYSKLPLAGETLNFPLALTYENGHFSISATVANIRQIRSENGHGGHVDDAGLNQHVSHSSYLRSLL